ncbi:hypothetical protein RI543_003621 [Arxiozyma heterogenica]|uniref:LisH domain-containing protein n=1 Tax=Arxiozyma heterogenica TaxID=278026 RepID=A0AAN7W1A2_9SACH|nr:hypothetical protein RI543_003621 [Kazachstania heterogenica]
MSKKPQIRKKNDFVNDIGTNSSDQELQFNDTLVVSDTMAGNSNELLYAHIYNYLLENKYYETARQFLRDADVPITRNLEVYNNENPDSEFNGNIAVSGNFDQRVKDTERDKEKEKEKTKGENKENKDLRQLLEQLPRDQLLRSKMIINSPDTFLLEWWQLFYLLNDFIEGSSIDTLNELDSPNYEYIYPLLPEKYPINYNNNNNNATTPISNEKINPTQQQEQSNYIPVQQPRIPTYLLQQMRSHNRTSRSNSTQQPPLQTNRRQMSPQDITSPPMYSQQSRRQTYSNQGQPSPGINENIATHENNPNFNSKNYQDKNNQTQLRSQAINNNDSDKSNPTHLLKNIYANGDNINMQGPLIQQQYMAMLKTIITKPPPYQNATNNNYNHPHNHDNIQLNSLSTA